MEYCLLDRMSWQSFTELAGHRHLPDARATFKELLGKEGGAEALFEIVGEQLAAAGLKARGGQIIDATFITVPKTDPPAELEIAVLKQGDGAEVADGASVTVHYTGVIWGTGEVFDSSWPKGAPATFTTEGVIPGFGKALVGQKVGSQVLAVIPPAEGYGEAGQGSIKGTDTLVFVVDILATQ